MVAGTPVSPRVNAYDDELARLDAVATIDALDRGDLSAGEVLEAAIARAEALDPQLGAIAFKGYDRARASVPRDRARRGSMAGVPTFIKDMVPVAGLPLTWGSNALAGGPPHRRSAGVGVDIEAMGMPILGSSTMPEWGFTPSTEFPHGDPTRNPWNPDHTVGGSSGGAAALVAAGVVPIAHAADGGGSIRIPAACAGLVGLKPTVGRVRRRLDEVAMPISIVVDGVVSRTVRDTARWYAELERVRPARSLAPMGEVTGPPSRRLRIGVLPPLEGITTLDGATEATVADTAALLADLGHRVEPAPIPVDVAQFREDFIAYFQFLVFLVIRTARLTHGPHVDIDRITRFTRGMADDFRTHPGRVIGPARRLRRTRRQVAELHRTYDLVLSPVVATVPPRLGYLSTALDYPTLLERMAPWMSFTPLANAAGTPALSLPMGFDEQTHLPVGVMLSADWGEEALLLQVGLELEQARPSALARRHA